MSVLEQLKKQIIHMRQGVGWDHIMTLQDLHELVTNAIEEDAVSKSAGGACVDCRFLDDSFCRVKNFPTRVTAIGCEYFEAKEPKFGFYDAEKNYSAILKDIHSPTVNMPEPGLKFTPFVYDLDIWKQDNPDKEIVRAIDMELKPVYMIYWRQKPEGRDE